MTTGNEDARSECSIGTLRSVAASSRSLRFAVDEAGRIEYASPSVTHRLGRNADELVGEPLESVVHPDDRETVRSALASALGDRDGSIRPTQVELERADGDGMASELTVDRVEAGGADAVVVEAIRCAGRERPDRDLERFADTLEQLHEATNRLYASASRDECHRVVIDAAVGVLGFDWCILAAPTPDDRFRVEAVSEGAPLSVDDRPLSVEEGAAGYVYRTKSGTVTADTRESVRSQPTHDFIRSSVTAPVGNWGVFQALSTSRNAFDEDDLKLAELLVTPMATAIERIDGEDELRTQRNELEHQYDRIESLHAVATEMKTCATRDEIYELVIDAVEEILAFDICILDEVDGDVLVPKAVGSGLSIADYYEETPIDSEDNLGGRCIREGETLVIDDLHAAGFAPAQSTYRSAISVPLREWGVFQVAADRRGAFDETDRRLTELLLEHATAAVDRIDRERELERRAAELERQNERLDEFSSLVSHDIRTPLSVATGYLELAREDHDHEVLAEVATALDRMEALIDGMLTLARGGDSVVDPSRVSLVALARGRWAEVATPQATLELTDDVPETLRADEDRLSQVFENLFRNAIEHGGDDVTVRVGGLTDDAGMYVEDDGPGIPAEERDRVLELGHSGDDRGTGYGLAIVADIAAAHGWEIELAESAAGGARVEFHVDDP